jgi:1-acyl-sn-glycerol-3-phosphate acyltransferase
MIKYDDSPLCPSTNSKLRKYVGKLILFLHRWKIEGSIHNSKKFVIVLGPHTTYWDFIGGIGTMLAIGADSKWFIAREFCWWPMGKFMLWLGGLPVDRQTRKNLVSEITDKFHREEELLLSIFPEGTTHKTENWKTGFWYIAKGAGIHIQLVGLDYKKRMTIFGPSFLPSNYLNNDMNIIKDYFKEIPPKTPEKFSL